MKLYAERMDDEQRELDAIHVHNKQRWEEFLGAPLDELFDAMTTDQLRAMLAILGPVAERKRRQVDRN